MTDSPPSLGKENPDRVLDIQRADRITGNPDSHHPGADGLIDAGGLGSLGCAFMNPEQFADQCAMVRGATNGAYNVNFFTHSEPSLDPDRGEKMRGALKPYYDEFGLGAVPAAIPSAASFDEATLDAVLKAAPPIVSFHFGPPSPDMVQAIKATGAVVLSSATTVKEARLLEQGGCDAVIAQGFEAGGHRGTFAAPSSMPRTTTPASPPRFPGVRRAAWKTATSATWPARKTCSPIFPSTTR
ncbi:MAG: nitronate monooxygenase [Proteobacteria bacterium]|nr:nitronate monooxygenase [Pseudomonadota bacterium]